MFRDVHALGDPQKSLSLFLSDISVLLLDCTIYYHPLCDTLLTPWTDAIDLQISINVYIYVCTLYRKLMMLFLTIASLAGSLLTNLHTHSHHSMTYYTLCVRYRYSLRAQELSTISLTEKTIAQTSCRTQNKWISLQSERWCR